MNLTAIGASSGLSTRALVGALAGLLVLNPLAGMAQGGAAGAAMGALSGSMSDFGTDDEFIKELRQTIPENSSALFLMVAKATPDKAIAEIEQYKPRILQTSLSQKQEDSLRAMIAAHTGGLQKSAATGTTAAYTVSTIDAVSIMSLLLTLTAELIVVAISLRLAFLNARLD